MRVCYCLYCSGFCSPFLFDPSFHTHTHTMAKHMNLLLLFDCKLNKANERPQFHMISFKWPLYYYTISIECKKFNSYWLCSLFHCLAGCLLNYLCFYILICMKIKQNKTKKQHYIAQRQNVHRIEQKKNEQVNDMPSYNILYSTWKGQ